MEEAHFIKCEQEQPPDTEVAPKYESYDQLPCSDSVEIKMEPDQMSDDPSDDGDILEPIKEEFLPQEPYDQPPCNDRVEVKVESPNDDDDDISQSIKEEILTEDVKEPSSDGFDGGTLPNQVTKIMEEARFIKCEPEQPPDTEESQKSEGDNQLPCVDAVENKVEPNQMFDDRRDILEFTKEEFLPQDVKEEPNDDDIESGKLPNELQPSLYVAIKEGNVPNLCESAGESSNDSEKHQDLSSTIRNAQDNNEICDVAKHKPKKSISCKECKKIFCSQSALDMHILVHTGERPFGCGSCSKTFRQKGALKTHLMRHNGQKSHVCPTCGKAFIEGVGLKRHIVTHTGEKKYTCKICNKSYCQWTGLNLHCLTHSGERAYECVSCGKTFLTKLARPEICPSCGKVGSLKSSQKKDLTVHGK